MSEKTSKNLVASFASQIIRYLAPLAFYPFLTRTLGADGFAVFALSFAAAQIVGQMVEFGFGLSGVRDLAEGRTDEKEQGRIFGDIVSGRLVLAMGLALCAGALWAWLPREINGDLSIAGAVTVLGLGYGFSASWYFVGQERAGELAFQEVCVSFAQLGLLLAFVNAESGSSLPVYLMAAPVWAALLYGHGVALRSHGACWPSAARLNAKIGEAFKFFCFTGLMPILNRANLLILGATAPATQVAYYAIGERIVTAVANATIPVTRVIMPRICALLQQDAARARDLFNKTIFVVCGLALVGALVGIVIAPWGLEFVFGEGLGQAFGVVAIQLLIIPLTLCSRMIGTLALVPMHRESAYQGIVLSGSVLGLLLAPLWIIWGQAPGLASGRLAIEAATALFCTIILFRNEHGWGGAVAAKTAI